MSTQPVQVTVSAHITPSFDEDSELKGIVGISLAQSQLRFRLTKKSDPPLGSVVLSNLEIRGENFWRQCGSLTATFVDGQAVTESIPVVFPTAGLYWIDFKLEAASTKVECYQVAFGQEGEGWPRNDGNEAPHNCCRIPLAVASRVDVDQLRLNKSIATLTKRLVVLTVVLLVTGVAQVLGWERLGALVSYLVGLVMERMGT